MRKAPVIGIPLDGIDPLKEIGGCWYSDLPWYGMRQRYCEAISEAGGIPIALPYQFSHIEDYRGLIDGLLLTGGGFDIDPILYGDQDRHPTVTPIRPQRTQFEGAIAQSILNANKPVLGICAGMQLLNVMHGGTLIQDIPSEIPSVLQHKQTQPRSEYQHEVYIVPNTHLGRLVKTDRMPVNSIHHQAVKKLADAFQINAAAPDGLIEGIESSQYRFCVGVQWHPEFHVSPADNAILQGFIEACLLNRY